MDFLLSKLNKIEENATAKHIAIIPHKNLKLILCLVFILPLNLLFQNTRKLFIYK